MVRFMVLILCFSMLVFAHPTFSKANESSTVYYVLSNSGGMILYRIADDNPQPERMYELPGAFSFSFSGTQITYMDGDGVWLTPLDDWHPVLIIPVEGIKSNWLWTPDDVRFIVSVKPDVAGVNQTYAYNMLTKQVELWDWGDCKYIARQIGSRRIAMICFANDWIEDPEVPAIAVFWGGEYLPYKPSEFDLLLENFYGYRPILPFEWGVINSRDHLVYRDRNPDFSLTNLEADEPVTDIFWLAGGSDVMNLNLSKHYGLTQWISVSPDRSMVAFDIDCTFYEPRDCLAVAELDSGQILYDFSKDFFVRFLYDIAWYPDNKRIAFLGQMDSLGEPILIVVDLENGQNFEYDLGGSLDQVDSIAIAHSSAN